MMPGSVLPPVKAYPAASLPAQNPGSPQILTDTVNSLKHPEGPEYQFHANEGTYVLRDDFQLATPPPHPSEAPPTSTNPLSTAPQPPVAGTKLSIVITSDNKAPPVLYNLSTAEPNFSTYSIKEQEESRPSQETNGNSSDVASQPLSVSSEQKAPAFGSANVLLSATNGTKDGSKRKKPKTNMMKTSSTFVSRVVPHEALTRRINERNADAMLVFANVNRALQWLDLTSESYFRSEHLTKILFTKAHMLCHDFNQLTKSTNHLDLVAGSSDGDIIWYEPFSVRYNRINKNGIISHSPVSEIKWIPGSENLFLASHFDGHLIVYDKEREDAPFTPEGIWANGYDEAVVRDPAKIQIGKSINSPNQKTNPVAVWKLHNHKINAFAFSPDQRHVAVVSSDGTLKVIDYLKEKLLDVYRSYFAELTCVCWSPDGKYILTGGQDDLVTIWSLADRSIVARCPGHSGNLKAVAFDPWRCDSKNYRFGSVGEDCKLLLWDFNFNTLSKPRNTSQRARNSSVTDGAVSRNRTDSNPAARLRSNSSMTANSFPPGEVIVHLAANNGDVAELRPVMAKALDDDPLSGLSFQEDCIITTCCVGHIRIWNRPKDGTTEP